MGGVDGVDGVYWMWGFEMGAFWGGGGVFVSVGRRGCEGGCRGGV